MTDVTVFNIGLLGIPPIEYGVTNVFRTNFVHNDTFQIAGTHEDTATGICCYQGSRNRVLHAQSQA